VVKCLCSPDLKHFGGKLKLLLLISLVEVWNFTYLIEL